MINLKDLLELNKMGYSDTVESKHQKDMNKAEVLISEVAVPNTPFPENSSRGVRNELQWLVNYNDGVINEDFVKKGDDINKVFKEYCESHNLKYDEEYYKKIIKESKRIILRLKYHYNRPRPNQLAEYYGVEEFNHFEIDSMKTPAYPSGHSTQGHLIACLLGKEHSGHYNNFKKLANMISHSRLMARAHYPSDCKFGEEVAQHILGKIIQKKYD